MLNEQYNCNQLAAKIKQWGENLGFCAVGITDTNLSDYQEHLKSWLRQNLHGDMHYLQANLEKRCYPNKLLPNTKSIIVCALNYFNNNSNTISCYAQGKDYHKLIRKRLEQLAQKIKETVSPVNYRCFCDSAPVLEKALAEKAGIGWQGKNSLIINKIYGSWIFLGDIFVDINLPIDKPSKNHCGKCNKCVSACPTQAIISEKTINAARCISYLTIENKASIPIEMRPLIGKKIYGCDNCQLICPWNKFAKKTKAHAFYPHDDFKAPELIKLFSWSEADFLRHTEGSGIRRIGYTCWLRNISVALGNSEKTSSIINALRSRIDNPSEIVREHVRWALKIP